MYQVIKRKNPRFALEALSRIVPALLEWLEEEDASDERKGEIALEVAFCLSGGGDGYKSASNLENRGWFPNADLVEILDGTSLRDYELAYDAAMEACNGPRLL